jgi:hypothetical protein
MNESKLAKISPIKVKAIGHEPVFRGKRGVMKPIPGL